jgi:hypothetical protein
MPVARSTHNALDGPPATGRLTVEQRQEIAADPAYRSLDQLMQAAELAGPDRAQVLSDAISAGSLDSARSYARVLHHRVHQRLDGQLTPQLNDVRELIPVADHGRCRRRGDLNGRRPPSECEVLTDRARPPASGRACRG